jgi:hypothetical protein
MCFHYRVVHFLHTHINMTFMYHTSNLWQFTYLAYVNFNVSIHVTSILQDSCLSFQRSCSHWQAIVSVFNWLYLCVWRPAFQFLTVFIQLRSFDISISSAAFCTQTQKVPCRACVGTRQTTWSLLTCCSKCSIPTFNEAAKETVCVWDVTSDRALGSHVFAFVSFYHFVLLTVNGPLQCTAENLLQLSGDLGLFCNICSFFSSHLHCILCPTLYCQLWYITLYNYIPSQSSLSYFSSMLLLSRILLATLVWSSLVTCGSYSHPSRSKRWSILTSWAVGSFSGRIILVCSLVYFQ